MQHRPTAGIISVVPLTRCVNASFTVSCLSL